MQEFRRRISSTHPPQLGYHHPKDEEYRHNNEDHKKGMSSRFVNSHRHKSHKSIKCHHRGNLKILKLFFSRKRYLGISEFRLVSNERYAHSTSFFKYYDP